MHLGSLYTALASYLDAHQHNGCWLLRIDDLDTPRNRPGAVSAILACLEAFGLYWDGEIYYQSQHLETYQQALTVLEDQQRLYGCMCSRKTLDQYPGVYPGFCRNALPSQHKQALRVKTHPYSIEFADALQGHIIENMAVQHGDFVVKRKDAIIAYQLAVVVDDHAQHVNHVVRGFDLLDSTPKQLFLQNLLNYPQPEYMHVPVIVDTHGQKLSKQSFATAIDFQHPVPVLWRLLALLRQNPPVQLGHASVAELLDWAVEHWQPQNLKKISAIQDTIE